MIRQRLAGALAVTALTAALALVPVTSASARTAQQDDWATYQQCVWDTHQLKHQGYTIAVPCYYTMGFWLVYYWLD